MPELTAFCKGYSLSVIPTKLGVGVGEGVTANQPTILIVPGVQADQISLQEINLNTK